MENEDDLYDFFYYVSPQFDKITDHSEKPFPALGTGIKSMKNRVQSEHQLLNSAKSKKFVVNKELKHM